jgi:hypothetical protein
MRPVEGLDLALLVDAQHDRAIRRVEIEPDDVAHFSTNNGSAESLKVSLRCGCRPNAFQMRWTVDGASPTALAIERRLQCAAPAARVSSLRRMVSAISS